jgi:hypothetical protein
MATVYTYVPHEIAILPVRGWKMWEYALLVVNPLDVPEQGRTNDDEMWQNPWHMPGGNQYGLAFFTRASKSF